MAKVKLYKGRKDGFFAIGIMQGYREMNLGTLWRSAFILGASYIFTVDKKYKRQTSDILKVQYKIPLFHFKDFSDLKNHLPKGGKLVGVELSDKATDIRNYEHPKVAVYLLGNEANGLSKSVLTQCHDIIKLPGNYSLNVAVAGSIVIYDRLTKVGGSFPLLK